MNNIRTFFLLLLLPFSLNAGLPNVVLSDGDLAHAMSEAKKMTAGRLSKVKRLWQKYRNKIILGATGTVLAVFGIGYGLKTVHDREAAKALQEEAAAFHNAASVLQRGMRHALQKRKNRKAVTVVCPDAVCVTQETTRNVQQQPARPTKRVHFASNLPTYESSQARRKIAEQIDKTREYGRRFRASRRGLPSNAVLRCKLLLRTGKMEKWWEDQPK